MALADYAGFNNNGFHIIAIVDADPEKVGRASRQGIPVLDAARLPEIVRRNRIDIGIIAVPAENAQTVCDAFSDHGITAILNFAPVQIKVRDGGEVEERGFEDQPRVAVVSFEERGGVGSGCQPAVPLAGRGGFCAQRTAHLVCRITPYATHLERYRITCYATPTAQISTRCKRLLRFPRHPSGPRQMAKPSKLLDRVRNAVRVRQYSPRTEEAYVM